MALREIISAGSTACRNINRQNTECNIPDLPDVTPCQVSLYFLGFLVLKVCTYINSNSKDLLLKLTNSSFMLTAKLRIRQIAMGNSHFLQERHEKLWANEVVDLPYCIVLMNEITGFDPGHSSNTLSFHGILVSLLLTADELDDLRAHVSSDRSTYTADGSADSS